MPTERFFTHPAGIIFSSVTATFLWGSAFPFIKLGYGLLEIRTKDIGEQMLFAGYRFFLASLLIFLFLAIMKKPLGLQKCTVIPLIKIGAFQTFLQYVFFYMGISLSTGIQGSIIAGTTSFFQMLIAHFMYQNDRFTKRKIFGLLTGFTGVVAVNLSKGDYVLDFGIGEILLLIAMLSAGYGNILAKEGANQIEVGYLTAYQMLFGSFGLLLIGVGTAGFMPFHFDGISLLILLYLAFISAAGFILWNNVMKYNLVGKVSIYLFLIPVFGVFLSSIVLGEAIHSFVLLGLGLVASGIIMINRGERQPHKRLEKAIIHTAENQKL